MNILSGIGFIIWLALLLPVPFAPRVPGLIDRYNGREWLDIPHMAALHGVINAVGFSLCGLVGWNLAEPRPSGGRQ